MANIPPDNLPSNQDKFLAQFFENQKEEIKIKAQELELRKQADKHNYEWARENLGTQERVLKSQSTENTKRANNKYIFIGSIIIVVLLFISFALYINKDQIVMELIKAAIYVLSGGAGGYYMGRNSKQNNQEVSEKKTIPAT